MSTISKLPYRLVDAEARAREHASFEIPVREERRRLRAGDLVKLTFESVDASDAERRYESARRDPTSECATLPGNAPAGERMWVTVTECLATIPRRYAGKLDNDPVTLPLKAGDRIDFGEEHIVEIDRMPEDAGGAA